MLLKTRLELRTTITKLNLIRKSEYLKLGISYYLHYTYIVLVWVLHSRILICLPTDEHHTMYERHGKAYIIISLEAHNIN